MTEEMEELEPKKENYVSYWDRKIDIKGSSIVSDNNYVDACAIVMRYL
jgi:hypothetical protein